MGGPSYDRDVNQASSYSSWGVSDAATQRLSSTVLDKSLSPDRKIIVSKSKNPVIIIIDVTGSNKNFARLIYDKMPMLYGQIEEKGYLQDFDIAILAVGDSKCDHYPIQVSDFAKGIEIDSWLEKLVLEGGGGANEKESYELIAHYLNEACEIRDDANPIVLFIGDEAAYETISKNESQEFGISYSQSTDEYNPFPILLKKFQNNVFMLLNKYCARDFVPTITSFWENALPSEHTIKIKEEKSIADLILGLIALTNKRTLQNIKTDMLGRGQKQERLANVTASLARFAETTALATMEDIHTDLSTPKVLVRTAKKGTRI